MPDRTPLYDAEARRGAVFAEQAGWLMPAHFGDPAAEYEQARSAAALFDRSHHGKIEVTGKDAKTFLHNLCTNDIKGLAPGNGCEAFLTTGQARIAGHAIMNLFVRPDGSAALWLDVAPGTNEKVFKHLDRYIVSEQVELADRTREFAQLHLAGPKTHEIFARVLGQMPDLALLSHVERPCGDGSIRVHRNDVLGLPGYDLVSPAGQAEPLWQALVDAGARPAGGEAYETLRVEAGTPVYGADISEANLPQEVGRDDRAISFNKGCYIGQETVARIRTYGHVNRLLVGLRLPTNTLATTGSRLYRDGKEVGEVTSSVVSPRLGTAVALAYVRRGSHAPGTALEVETAAGRQAAEVVGLPFGGPAPVP